MQKLNLLEDQETSKLGDFTTTPRTIMISAIALVIGIISAFVALVLLRLIGLVTNLFFYQRWDTNLVSPVGNHLGIFEVLVPIIGALIIGLMARYGSDKIRGHGIPEALESILVNGSKVETRVTILKPISAAISIGSGGPFGAEGPIIMTGGALGSLIAQYIHLSSSERKTLLVAGAAAGMSAVFASPVAAVLLAVELMLFEWKPRSLIPVVVASSAAMAMRYYLLGGGPLFPTPHFADFVGVNGLLGCVLLGVLASILSMLLTAMVYACEDAFHRLPIHWMWWPAIGGLVIGIGGLIFPQALGVGYDMIGALLQGHVTLTIILGILIVKSIIWAVSLGSGTSGGVVAPLLMTGGALGALVGLVLPGEGAGFWAMIGMAAVMGGTMRVPLTAIVFALELTHDINAALPLLVAVSISYFITVLIMRRSILTEKVSRRGYHLSSEYEVDPLEVLFVREVMRTNIVVLSEHISLKELAQSLNVEAPPKSQGQSLYPILDDQQKLSGVVTRRELQSLLREHRDSSADYRLNDLLRKPEVAYPDETLRAVVYRMAELGINRFPVVERDDPQNLLGIISLTDLLKARLRHLEEERRRERVLHVRHFWPVRSGDEAEHEKVPMV
ncbi:chloride channel protein [Ktedonosporobacter rubrisoli]|uniref:Chloride channel protein n=2 Tax=Ktedonosporobacter rubrisoli TaxID=2509675 RepID=A0A4V0Z0L9_KTERU|nr:chloride channel protein [Ktedonosporobacter rubrisoli]